MRKIKLLFAAISLILIISMLCAPMAFVGATAADDAAVKLSVNAGNGKVKVEVNGSEVHNGAGTYTADVAKGASVTLTAVVGEGEGILMFWADKYGYTVSKEDVYSFTANSDTSITAYFETVEKSTIVYRNNTDARKILAVVARDAGTLLDAHLVDSAYKYGHSFKGWDLTVAKINEGITAGKGAIYVDPYYEVSADKCEITVVGGKVNGSASASVDMFTDITLTPDNKATFVAWKDGDGNIISDKAELSVKAFKSETYTAVTAATTLVPTATLYLTPDENEIVHARTLVFAPAGTTVVSYGLLYVKNTDYTTSDMKVENVGNDSVLKMASYEDPTGVLVNRFVDTDYVVARAYLTYTDGSTTATVYSAPAEMRSIDDDYWVGADGVGDIFMPDRSVGTQTGDDSKDDCFGKEPDPYHDVPESLKILAIGNSFAEDACTYLYNVAKSAGVKSVIVAFARVGGCTLDMHYDYATNDTATYQYCKNTSGSLVRTDGYKLSEVIADEDWDYITLQQGSHDSGMPDTYTHIQDLINYVNKKKTNPKAELLWHMTWAYQADSTHSGFANYDNDQSKMYAAIVKTTKEKVVPTNAFVDIIPSGTAVQNARTSFIGDNMTRDGYHMSLPFGRYLTALTYFAAITESDISNISYAPSGVNSEMKALAKEAVKSAIENKYAVTKSSFAESIVNKADATDAQLAGVVGVDLSGYEEFKYEYITNSYYNCTTGTTPGASSSSQNGRFICFKERIAKAKLLNAIIICDIGWQYRPEAWSTESGNASTRADSTTTRVILLDEAWWGSNIYLGLNICTSPASDISADYSVAAAHVRIYVPAS